MYTMLFTIAVIITFVVWYVLEERATHEKAMLVRPSHRALITYDVVYLVDSHTMEVVIMGNRADCEAMQDVCGMSGRVTHITTMHG